MLAQAGARGRGGETPPPQALLPLGKQCQEQPWPPGLGRVWAGRSGYFRWLLACWLWDGIAMWLSTLTQSFSRTEHACHPSRGREAGFRHDSSYPDAAGSQNDVVRVALKGALEAPQCH